ncbi:hypothetical protein [Pelagicoccus mobilis]|uniref:Heparinase II/III-like protein n=1 Tax=Pelagicoccus mobilis TaxID=415221 RepID=A0A934RV87_9BACT|nr:hypothetical protein [Pelagicoccus mobilis]MBK1875446.1 hypothetical protein [Pelagicoccus mobilis]
MKKIVSTLCAVLALSTFAIAGEVFENPLEDQAFDYSEKSVQKYIRKAASTKAARVEYAFENATGEGLREAWCPYFANLYLGRDLDETNARLLELLTTEDPVVQQKYRMNDHWCLAINQQFYHMYYAFGSKGAVSPGRLYPETERALLELLWNRMKYKDDIHLAGKSTWWMVGSENHDLVAKVSSLISSQIFMNEPDFKDRLYPDLGTGGGNKYWFHRMYAKDAVDGPQGRADWGDGKDYTARDHYRAWCAYFDEYFTERAKKGFFLERASSNYMAVTVSYLTDIFDLCDDPSLVREAESFIDLVWAEWAQDQLNGVRGGAKTRNNGLQLEDAMYEFARFYMGGKGSSETHFFAQLLSDYELKPIHWEMALDREGLGEFEYISRTPGEEENVWPRPLGTERTLVCDTDSRLKRYSWVTPDYILGCQMDHPGAIHSHLSNQARWQGITFKGPEGPRVFPTDFKEDDEGNFSGKKTSGFCRAVQDRKVMIVQQARRWSQMNPDWFPAKSTMDLDYAIHFGANHDRLLERDGWIFVENGDAFLAVRPVMGEYADGWTILVDDASPGLESEIIEDSYEWTPDRETVLLKDKHAGMIFEASRRIYHATLEDFMEDVLDNLLVLDKTVVPGFHVLRYRGCGEEAQEIVFNLANNEIPMIGGQRVDFAPDMVFDSPYLKSEYESGIVKISKGDRELILDFN